MMALKWFNNYRYIWIYINIIYRYNYRLIYPLLFHNLCALSMTSSLVKTGRKMKWCWGEQGAKVEKTWKQFSFQNVLIFEFWKKIEWGVKLQWGKMLRRVEFARRVYFAIYLLPPSLPLTMFPWRCSCTEFSVGLSFLLNKVEESGDYYWWNPWGNKEFSIESTWTLRARAKLCL